MKNKRGITLTTIIIYVILFFLFTSVITVLSTRLNKNLFNDRGMAINVNNVNKLEYNLLASKNESDSAEVTKETNTSTITFSNGDIYVFDENKEAIYKNNGVLVKNVNNFTVYPGKSYVYIKATFKKYLNTVEREIKLDINSNWYVQNSALVNFDAKENQGYGNYDENASTWTNLSDTSNACMNLNLISGEKYENGSLLIVKDKNAVISKITFPNTLELEQITLEINLKTTDQLGSGGEDYIYPIDLINESGGLMIHFGFRKNIVLMYYSGDRTVFGVNGNNIIKDEINTISIVQESLTTRKLYINGNLCSTNTGLALSNILVKNVRLWRNALSGYKMNSTRLYSRALTAEEIAANYEVDLMRYGK